MAMQDIAIRLEPIWKSQVLADVSSSLVESVRKLVPEATTSQIKKVLVNFSPPDVQLSAAALRNYLNLKPLDGSTVRRVLSPRRMLIYADPAARTQRRWNTEKRCDVSRRFATD